MIDNSINDIAKESLEALKHFDKKLIDKMPQIVWNNLEELSKMSKKRVNIDMNLPLKEQNILEESKDLISVIYYKYIASEEDKRQIFKAWNK